MVIVAAVDDESDALVVAEARSLADAFDEELHVVHVRDRETIEESAGGKESALESARRRAGDVAEGVTDEFVAVGRIGRPAKELDEYVGATDARYLVVGGRKRTPIGKALFGSVTQSVLLSVDASVVTVRTPDE